MPVYPNKTPFKRAVDGKITPDVAGDALESTIIDADNNTISEIDDNEIKAAAAIAESKLALDFATSGLNTRATSIENDIDYPTAVKTKTIIDTGEDGGVEGGVFNGDFEYGSGSQSGQGWIGDEKYGWYGWRTAAVFSASYDASVSHSGNKSLKLSCGDVAGRGYVIQSRIDSRDLIYIKPNTKYRLYAWLKTNNVAADACYINCINYDILGNAGTTFTSSKLSGDNDWTYIETIFTSDADAAILRINLLNTVVGNISDAWFDDIKLEQIDTQAVNTQVDEIVSVSVEGVTTTDNIDQSQTSGTDDMGRVDASPSTQGQTFTPTKSKHTGVDIYGIKVGSTGDVTCEIYKWDTDYATTITGSILSSITILQANLINNDYNKFDLPCILEIGAVYLYHFTGTGIDLNNTFKLRGNITSDDYSGGNAYETGIAFDYDLNFKQQFAKHTESPVISVNCGTLDITGVKLLTGATITVNADGSGRYEYSNAFETSDAISIISDIFESTNGVTDTDGSSVAHSDTLYTARNHSLYPHTFRFETAYPISKIRITATGGSINDATDNVNILVSFDNINFTEILVWDYDAGDTDTTKEALIDANGETCVYVKLNGIDGAYVGFDDLSVIADLNCQTELPIFSPSTEVTTETEDLTQNPIDISEDGYWQLKSDLTGWGSRTFTMLASEAEFESQAVSANYIYMYDSNGTTPWTWDERSGLVPPADRTSGTVTSKFLVGDNQIRLSVNDGSMKANVNLSWNEESLRAAINRLTALANLQYPIVVEVEDVPAIDLQDQPTGADAETGYTNDVTSLRQTTAGVAAIAYTGLLPRENQFSEWLDITVVCSDGDGTLQGKLYTVDGILVETYADLESNPVIVISNPDYKYSRERLILQISASVETSSSTWSVTDIKWRYQYNG